MTPSHTKKLYPKIDLTLKAQGGTIKKIFTVKLGGNPQNINTKFKSRKNHNKQQRRALNRKRQSKHKTKQTQKSTKKKPIWVKYQITQNRQNIPIRKIQQNTNHRPHTIIIIPRRHKIRS